MVNPFDERTLREGDRLALAAQEGDKSAQEKLFALLQTRMRQRAYSNNKSGNIGIVDTDDFGSGWLLEHLSLAGKLGPEGPLLVVCRDER
jgi:hypothetical protein